MPAAETPLDRSLGWQREGTARFEAAVAALGDADLAAPSALPGWSRAHVVAHLARNADALANLLDWARTGIENPMYHAPGQRERDIEASARQEPESLRADLAAADLRLATATASHPAVAWQARVRSALGRSIPASEVPWLRTREVWVHLVDLDAGVSFDALPADLVRALLDDITQTVSRRGGAPDLVLEATDDPGPVWTIADGSAPGARRVSGRAADLLRWAAGRPLPGPGGLATEGPLPVLPRWL
ncbi:maleylpyruvate isomerase [Streptomyces sulfonofaciens]|uniref:Maleylpyruvate isomerase n=1 Tax=Streptomyces sulfonofaciens TaxID=68272 RepID=A0A919GE56_9ACTN|nr:maleylpyruvate isomerase family mycothiol-dependent enzyme [Streptomyces sulfonofaciens]GHH82289.1 maleylpyruvate isomerase [Streptomyces sulfonofaciens]